MGDQSDGYNYKELEMAAFHNNHGLVQDWLENDEQDDNPWRGNLLNRAAYHHSVDVVKCIINFENCNGVVNHLDAEGKTPLHYAAEGSGQTDIKPVNLTNDLLDIIGYLFHNGANPTAKSNIGRTPRDVAIRNGFKLGATLLEILEYIWLKDNVWNIKDKTAKICLHKELLQWAVERLHDERIVTCILQIHISAVANSIQPCMATVRPEDKPVSKQSRDDDNTNRQFLLGTAEGLYSKTLIHIAVSKGNLKSLKPLIICSGLRLNTIINLKWRRSAAELESGKTPLSMALPQPSFCHFVEVFIKLQSDGNCVTHIDLSNMMVDCLPWELFNFNCISNLNVSNNNLTSLSLVFEQFVSLRFSQLTDLDLSKNQLSNLPIELFRLPALENLNISNNPLVCLPEQWWCSNSLVKLNASRTHLTELCAYDNVLESLKSLKPTDASDTVNNPHSSSSDTSGCRLKVLDISSSRLKSFPKNLACYFPNLTCLNVSHNKLTSCCGVNELPPLLEELDISDNDLESETNSVFHLSTDTLYCHFTTKLDSPLRCSHMLHKSLKNLWILNLSDNHTLKDIIFHYDDLTASTNTPSLFFPKLKKLSFNNCGLMHTPLRLGRMSRIYHLDISNNKMSIPREICNLSQLSTFVYNGLPDPVVADLSKFTTVKDKQIFLLQENARRAPSLKLMLVGLSGRGKSTLLSHLKYVGKTKYLPITFRQRLETMSADERHSYANAYPEEIQSTVGIDQDLWCYTKSMDTERGASSKTPITFYVWDFAGQEEYSAAHQCFITENSLYVLCWRACDGEQGIQELKGWLLTIKARAKSAVVVIVGTHIDQVTHFRKEKRKLYTDKIIEMYTGKSWYPTIKAIKYVCCDTNSKKYLKHKEKITDLRDTLYDVASEMKLSLGDGRRFEQKLIDMMIPERFLELQERIHYEARNFKLHKEKGPPILSQNEILKLGKKCGFKEDNETAVAIKYAQEQGRLMHFDSFGLNDYYFVDSQWLCDMFAHVVSSEFNAAFARDGKANRNELESSLTENFRIPGNFMEAIINLLGKFELAIPLDGNTFLIPSLLHSRNTEGFRFSGKKYKFPRNKDNGSAMSKQGSVRKQSSSTSSLNISNLPTNTECCSVVAQHLCTKEVVLHSTGMCYRRIFAADYIPVNFWPRLIARFLSSAKSFHKIICNNCFTNVHCENLLEAGNAVIGNLPCRWSCGKSHITLKLGDDVIFCANGLYGADDVDNKRKKTPISHSVTILEKMHIYHGSNDGFKSVNVSDGFEISIHDYIVNSGTNTENLTHESTLMGAQILSRVLEIIDEVLKGWFEGLTEHGIYSTNYLTQFIPCPYCFGDIAPKDVLDATLEKELDEDPCDNEMPGQIPSGLVGFSFQYCLHQARLSNFVKCFNSSCSYGKRLSLKCLAPDIMFEDKKFTKINPESLKNDNTLGRGGFGAVYKSQYLLKGCLQDVAVKCFTKEDVKTLAVEDLCQLYAEVRSEFNKLMSVNHHHIVKCIGFCVPSLSFVLELAPRGSLRNIMNEHKRSGYYMCPNSLIAIVTQVSEALDYLHTKELIAHYDIKPANILVFRFPTVGHDCFEENNHNFECTFCKDDHVEVKLADLGISAFLGPRGFHRKAATPGHTAPEAIQYAGKEPLSQKVDIFSLGITLYELMTLQFLPPPNSSPFEFDSDIKDGIRPPFLDKVPNYPLYPAIIKELVVSCWAQDYASRPSAREILSVLQSCDSLKLSSVLKTELPYSTVSAALVVTADKAQSLWLAHTINDQYNVTVYEFYGLDGPSLNDLYKSTHTIPMKSPVLAICQVGLYVLLVLKCGTLAAISTSSFKVEYQVMECELARDDLVQTVTFKHQVVIAYKDGTVAIASCQNFEENDVKKPQIIKDDMICVVANKHKDLKLLVVKVASSHLYAIEACKSENSEQVELWCGCDNSFIEIFTHDGLSQLKSKAMLNTHLINPTDIPKDASIVQLKFSFNATTYMMYALHSCGHVISCWSVSEQPVLKSLIKLTQLISSPACEIFSLIKDLLIITDKDGKMYQLTPDHATDHRDDHVCQQLPGSHQPGKLMHLFRLHGMMGTKGSLTILGSPDTARKGYNYANNILLAVKSFPCVVLLGVRAGHGMLQAVDDENPSLYFTTWTFPTDSPPVQLTR